MKTKRIFLTWLVLSALSSCLYGQQKSRGTTKKPATATPARTAANLEPFNLQTSTLPPRYVGLNPQIIYDALSKRMERSEKKGEFETTEAFRQRVQAESNLPFLGSLSINSPLDFKVNSVEAVYNADAGELNIAVELNPPLTSPLIEKYSGRTVTLRYESDNSKYVGQNALGASRVVERTDAQSYELLLNNWLSFRPTKYQTQMDLQVNASLANKLGSELLEDTIEITKKDAWILKVGMSPSAAMRSKEAVAVLAITRLLPPYVSTGFWGLDPTITKPKDMSKTEYYLNGEIVELWVYNKLTGEIYKKQSVYSDRKLSREALDSEATLIASSLPSDISGRIDNILVKLAKLTTDLSRSRRLYGNGVGALEWIGEMRKVKDEIKLVTRNMQGQYMKFNLTFAGDTLELAAKFLMAKESAVREFESLSQENKDFMIKTWSLEGVPVSGFSSELGVRSYIFQNDAKFMWELIKSK